ncbi:hypothetical protein HELRODRAFT_112963 [Helobdella robusta]|uniref:SMP-30/Gluconolactonase/LRE-like region domain-containing protein n=1 Tax=Helobdella robusta TaxID=6412 RepID=T1EFN6_HELRO|nr:hypothetical protein HELRODRAFT_112963 [Helobdella robusta]ESO00823.1 hypothetical protein HELRODRAFT_112963 [Helobdella robusta]
MNGKNNNNVSSDIKNSSDRSYVNRGSISNHDISNNNNSNNNSNNNNSSFSNEKSYLLNSRSSIATASSTTARQQTTIGSSGQQTNKPNYSNNYNNNYNNSNNNSNNTYVKPPRHQNNQSFTGNIRSPHLPIANSSSSSGDLKPSAGKSQALLSITAKNILNVESIAGTGMTEEEIARSILPTIQIGPDFRRIKMEYHCKFGEYGNEAGLFTEPSGVAVGRDNEILVADANNHRIQVFDSTGAFRRIIGQDSTRGVSSGDVRGSQNEGDLVYPNRLAVNKVTGCIYVTERSPTHQVRVYDETGRFVRRFGAHVLQHPRGITVDRLGRIIVIECKVMRVVIFNSSGSVLNRFIVEKKVNFPNGVAVNDKEEIFISDNRRHGVVVFDYQGAFLRTIGGIGITNYPIGVGINSAGEVVVADNHNNFNVTLFTQDGQLIRALESRVKHAQCFDTALMGDGSIVLSSKDYRIYIYHYGAYPPSNDNNNTNNNNNVINNNNNNYTNGSTNNNNIINNSYCNNNGNNISVPICVGPAINKYM